MAAFLGVAFLGMDYGLLISVGLGVIRALLYVVRPATCKLGKLNEFGIYRDVEQYPASTFPGLIIVQLGSPVYFSNSVYVKERVMRYVKSQQRSNKDVVEQVILDMSGVTSIDTTAIEGLLELNKMLEKNGIEMFLVNPRLEVMEKLIISKFVDKLGKESFYLTLDDAVKASQYSLKKNDNGDIVHETSHA